MRKLLFILLAVLLLPCCVHQPQNGVRSLLKEAERMMRTSPDTAYFLLREMGATMYLKTEADSAYHGLLLMEAQAKNGIKLTDTTIIEKLAHYYKEKQDSLMQIRLLRLRALVHRDGGRYEKAVKCYNIVIDKAKRMGEKRWLADIYNELAHLHYSEFLILEADSCKQLSDSLFGMTEQLAKELGDSVLWMKSLIAPISVSTHREGMMDNEQQLLQALDLAVSLKDSATEANVSMLLSMVYGEKGNKEKVLPYVRRSLSLRKRSASEAVSCIALGNAYQRIGMGDSATYYLERGKELRKKEGLAKITTPVKEQSEETVRSRMSLLGKWKQQQEELERQTRYKHLSYVALICLFVCLVIGRVWFFRKSRYHKKTEKQYATLKDEMQGFVNKHAQLVNRLSQQDGQLQEQEALLGQKEEEIRMLKQRLDNLSSDKIDVLNKVKRIIADFRCKESSEMKMEDSDWLLLQHEMDKRLGGVLTRIQKQYRLSDIEVCIFCLILADIPTSYQYCLFDRSINYPYKKIKSLLEKLGIDRGSSSYKEKLQSFIANLG